MSNCKIARMFMSKTKPVPKGEARKLDPRYHKAIAEIALGYDWLDLAVIWLDNISYDDFVICTWDTDPYIFTRQELFTL